MTVLKPIHAIFLALLGMLLIMLPNGLLAETSTPANNFGRLFTHPETRQSLDANRTHIGVVKKTPAKTIKRRVTTKRVKPKPPLPALITLQGYVKRTDGANTVWINKKAVRENSTVDHVNIGRLTNKGTQNSTRIKSNQTLKKIDQLSINIPANGQYVKLKAGQVYDPEYNAVTEITSYARDNQIQLKPTVKH